MATDAVALPALQEAVAGLNSPPDSNPANKDTGSDSDLSELESDQAEQMFMSTSPPVPQQAPKPALKHDPSEVLDIQPVAVEGGVPIFKPSAEEFSDFIRFMNSINHYGMKSGIVKVIPPKEWVDAQPPLDESVKTINIRDPISQDFQKGSSAGEYRQINMDHRKSYNLPQWRKFCEMRDAPKPRGQRNQAQAKSTPTVDRRKSGTPRGKKVNASKADATETPRPMTPMSPSGGNDDDAQDEEQARPMGRMGGGRQAPTVGASISERRKHGRRATGAIDHAAFEGFDYRLNEDFDDKRCDDLEVQYWRSLMNAPPLYGADMMGSLFDERTKLWNLGKLKNILDVLGEEIPGVNTAYLYLGSWKATFAWHLEDVDLYSINYLHFGAPKQWYSIAQGDVPRFEAAMSKAFPDSSKSCTQFLRHKTFLISPARLQAVSGVKVNKIVHRPGEFVITFPYGYHSGYNLGYNCAEAVNFALETWLDIGLKAQVCDCAEKQDPVFIDVRKLKKKLGYEVEPSEDEYESYDEEDYDSADEPTDLPTPPQDGGDVKIKVPTKKRKRPVGKDNNVRRIRIKLNHDSREPCVLCPNDIPSEPLLPTDTGKQAHKICARYIPETDVESGFKEMVTNISRIDKARQELKCFYCKRKKGACFQCSQKKCHRAYHATCAAAAGVFVEEGWTPIFAEDGTEYKKWDIEFSCRFHRPKRDKKYDGEMLGEDKRLLKAAAELKKDDVVQAQFWNADIWAGVVLENRKDEETILLEILPACTGAPVEVEYKWLLLPNPADSRLQKPSPNAKEMPKELSDNRYSMNKRQTDDLPRAEDHFVKGCTWAEFNRYVVPRNPAQVRVDFSKRDQIWYYLGKTSTEAKAQFTENPAKPRDNRAGHFLDTIPKASAALSRPSYAATYPSKLQHSMLASPSTRSPHLQSAVPRKPDREYVYKPRTTGPATPATQYYPQHQYPSDRPAVAYNFGTDPRWQQGQYSASANTPNRWQYGANPVSNNYQGSSMHYQTPSHMTSNLRPPPSIDNGPKWTPPSARWQPGPNVKTPDQETLSQFLADSDALSYRPVVKGPPRPDERQWESGYNAEPPAPRPVTAQRPPSQTYNTNPPANGQYSPQYTEHYQSSPMGNSHQQFSSSPQPQIYHSHSIPKTTTVHTQPQPPLTNTTAAHKTQEKSMPRMQQNGIPKNAVANIMNASNLPPGEATKPVPKFTSPSKHKPVLPPKPISPPKSILPPMDQNRQPPVSNPSPQISPSRHDPYTLDQGKQLSMSSPSAAISPPKPSQPIPNQSKQLTVSNPSPPILPPKLSKPTPSPQSSSRSHSTNPFLKYPYLQREHNRSALDYKSPYRPGPDFGFMNGYQGQLLSVEQLSKGLHSKNPTMHPAIRQQYTSYFNAPPSAAQKSSSLLQAPSLYSGLNHQSQTAATTYNPMFSAAKGYSGHGSQYASQPSHVTSRDGQMQMSNKRITPEVPKYQPSQSAQSSGSTTYTAPRSYSAAHPAAYNSQRKDVQKPSVVKPSVVKPSVVKPPAHTTPQVAASSTPLKPHDYPPILPPGRKAPSQAQKSQPAPQLQNQTHSEEVERSSPQTQTSSTPDEPYPPLLKGVYPGPHYPTQKSVVPDVPADTTSLVEAMLMKLRKA